MVKLSLFFLVLVTSSAQQVDWARQVTNHSNVVEKDGSGIVTLGTTVLDPVNGFKSNVSGQPPFRLIPTTYNFSGVYDDAWIWTYNVAWNGTGWNSRDVDNKPTSRLGFENNYKNGSTIQAEFNWDVANSGTGTPSWNRVFNFERATDGQPKGMTSIFVPVLISTPAGFDLSSTNGASLRLRSATVGFDFSVQNSATQPAAGVPWMRIGGAANDSPVINAGNATGGIYLGLDNAAKVVLGSGGGAVIIPSAVTTPASAGAACTTGQFAFDSSYAYFCVATNTWRRVATASW